MKKQKSFLQFQIVSVIFAIILGTLLHFTFQWSENNYFVAAFSAVNESVWEHLKLVFFPMLITTIIGYFYFKDSVPNYLCAKTFGILVAITFITVFFYSYTGIIGKNFAVLDIGSFFVAILLGEYLAYKKINPNYLCNKIISIVILCIILFSFIFFTYFPLRIGFFKDPVIGTYGINSSN